MQPNQPTPLLVSSQSKLAQWSLNCFVNQYMKNTKTIALIAFTAMQFASGAISAQQLANSSTKRDHQQGQAKESARSSSNDRMKLSDSDRSDKKSRKSSGDSLKEDSRRDSDNDKMSLGGADAGGAFAVRQNGKLLTLTEAGFIFTKSADEAVVQAKKYPTYYSISPQTKEELRTILKALPLSSRYDASAARAADILASDDRSIFIDARSVVQPGVYEKIKKDYQNLLKLSSKTIQLNRDNSALPAYSDAEKTYILAAFEEYSPRQQALTLIHEYLMRTVEPVSQKILSINQIDNLIQAYLNSDRSEASAVAYTNALNAISTKLLASSSWEDRRMSSRDILREVQPRIASLMDYSVVLNSNLKQRSAALKTIEQQLGRPILASELFLKPSQLYTSSNVSMDMSLVQKFDSILPATTVFSGVNFSKDVYNFVFDRSSQSYVENLTELLQAEASDYSADHKPQYSKIAMQLSNEFDDICRKYHTEVEKSDVPNDKMLHTSTVNSKFYIISCLVNGGVRGYGMKLEIGKN